MKLNPPKPETPEGNPYVEDLFDRKEFGASLTSLFKNVEDSIVLSVDALWGDGKTTFARMWMADLNDQKINCIYYDAFEHDYSDDPFVSFCAEIISLVESKFSGSQAIQKSKEDFKEKAKRIGGKALSLTARIGLKTISFGAISDDDANDIGKIARDISTNSSTMSKIVEQEIEDYDAAKDNLDQFKEKLAELGGAVKEAQNFPLLIIVDELDRCKPEFALALIERIKHLFSTENVSFLLLVNMKQMENYVEAIYGTKVDARNYLHKFITLSTKLPKSIQQHNNDYSKYNSRLIDHYGINRKYDIDTTLVEFFRYFNFTLREMERCFTILSLYYSQLPERRLTDGIIIPFLAIIKIQHSDIFNHLLENNLSYEDFVKFIDIEKVNQSGYEYYSFDYLMDDFKYLLMTDDQCEALESKDENSQNSSRFTRIRMDRKQVIPFFCSELIKFSIVGSESNSK